MKYLLEIGGKASMSVVTKEGRAGGLGIDVSNSVSESVHAASTVRRLAILVQFGLNYCAAIGQSCFNNDFGRAH